MGEERLRGGESVREKRESSQELISFAWTNKKKRIFQVNCSNALRGKPGVNGFSTPRVFAWASFVTQLISI